MIRERQGTTMDDFAMPRWPRRRSEAKFLCCLRRMALLVLAVAALLSRASVLAVVFPTLQHFPATQSSSFIFWSGSNAQGRFSAAAYDHCRDRQKAPTELSRFAFAVKSTLPRRPSVLLQVSRQVKHTQNVLLEDPLQPSKGEDESTRGSSIDVSLEKVKSFSIDPHKVVGVSSPESPMGPYFPPAAASVEAGLCELRIPQATLDVIRDGGAFGSTGTFLKLLQQYFGGLGSPLVSVNVLSVKQRYSYSGDDVEKQTNSEVVARLLLKTLNSDVTEDAMASLFGCMAADLASPESTAPTVLRPWLMAARLEKISSMSQPQLWDSVRGNKTAADNLASVGPLIVGALVAFALAFVSVA